MKSLGFIGAGNMAQALARGLLARKIMPPSAMIASDPDPVRRRSFARSTKIETLDDNSLVVNHASAIVLAVKPQVIDQVMDQLRLVREAHPVAAKPRTRTNASAKTGPLGTKLFISIAAGVPIARLEEHLGRDARVIRVMPNAPAMVSQGMAALVRGAHATQSDLRFGLKLFQAVGRAVALSEESLLDAVTALSGSGPAYVYLFVKALAEAATNEGLPDELALSMAIQTVFGAATNLRESKLAPAELIRIVASPGGTTEAALRRLAEAGFSDLVANALHAAAARSRELGRSG